MANEPLEFGQYYHIYNRGNNRENLFVEERNYPYFLRLFGKYIPPIAHIFAYCLMPNHFHFLIRTYTEAEQEAYWREKIEPISEIGSIFKLTQPSRAFNNMFIAYARAFNKATGRTGVLFETPFGRKKIDSEAYFETLVIYIHHNPQKHGFVDDFRDWKWSSYGTFAAAGHTNIQRAEVLDWFGGTAQFAAEHTRAADELRIATLLDDEDWFNEDWFNLAD